MKIRTDALAKQAIAAWPALSVAQSLIDAANRDEMRKLAARQDLGKVKMSAEARSLFEELRKRVLALNGEVLELAEPNSVSYHGPNFFLEVLPRRYRLALLLPLEFSEIEDPSGLARDATERKFIVHAQHEGGVSLSITDADVIERALPLIRQARAVSNA